jgi:hypothetical protein
MGVHTLTVDWAEVRVLDPLDKGLDPIHVTENRARGADRLRVGGVLQSPAQLAARADNGLVQDEVE